MQPKKTKGERKSVHKKKMAHLAKMVMDKCITVNCDAKPKDESFWVEFYYEFLEDTFSHWDESGGSNALHSLKYEEMDEYTSEDDISADGDNGTKETSLTSKPTGNCWMDSEENGFVHGKDDGNRKKYSDGDDEGNGNKDNYRDPKVKREQSRNKKGRSYDVKGKLEKTATPYRNSPKENALNHPLNIMVTSERVELLRHPLVSSLLSHKWSKTKWLFWASLFYYFVFVAMLTGYVVVVPPSFYARHANKSSGVSWFVDGEQRWIEDVHENTLFFFGHIGDWIIFILCVGNLAREVFQLCFARLAYFSLSNLLEWVLYLVTMLFVLPLSGVKYYPGISLRLDWQWQCGAVSVFLAWINLILFFRRFATLGIYVIMFLDILWTFLKFAMILILFLIAFSMAFYALLMNQQPFHRVEYSFVKTFVMMIGEMDFGDIFHSQNYLGTENTLADGEESYFLSSVFFQGITYTMFVLFIIIMSVLVMNMLVGLAVDNIHAIQEKAKLHRLSMQVELVMGVQNFPVCIWRSAVVQKERYLVNQSWWPRVTKWYRIITGDAEVLQQAIDIGMNKTGEGDSMKNKVTTDQLLKKLKYRVKTVRNKVDSVNERVDEESRNRKDDVTLIRSDLKDRFERIEKMIDALLYHNVMRVAQSTRDPKLVARQDSQESNLLAPVD